jgi:tRNA G18 (ribose-2'-O)-methylase SpoU
MFRVQTLDSIDGPELAPYRTMRRQTDHRREGLFIAEGPKVVERMLQSHFGVVSLLISENWLALFEPLLRARPEDIPVYVAPRSALNEITGFHLFQGALALGRVPPGPSLQHLLVRSPSPQLFVAAEQLTSAENMGMLVRNCAGFGVHGLITGETCVSPYLRRAVRNSMGTIFKLPIVESTSLAQALWELRKDGVRCIAAHPHTDRLELTDCDLTCDCCIVLGSEGYGLSAEILAICHHAAAIPMANGVDSLNVGNAGAIFLYEANRQRRTVGRSHAAEG